MYATEWYEIDPKTVCQYTEFLDKNNKEICKNSIIKDEDGRVGIIRFGMCDSYHIGFYVEWISNHTKHYRQELGYWALKSEVIGNIFDNPELLKIGEEDN